MASKLGGLGTVAIVAATATCGLFMLSGVGPAAGDAPLTAVAPPADDSVPETAPETSGPEPTTPDTTEPTTTEPQPPDSTEPPPSSSSTSTSTTTSTTVPGPSLIPLSVTASTDIVGAGGVVTFSGTCPVGSGSLVVWIIGTDTEVVDTGVASADWAYTWTAPTEESAFGSFTFQFWCGDPTGSDIGYPAELQRTVDMVAQQPDPPPLVESNDGTPTPVIPETD